MHLQAVPVGDGLYCGELERTDGQVQGLLGSGVEGDHVTESQRGELGGGQRLRPEAHPDLDGDFEQHTL
ncbi:MAG TPA: hypothetical protein VMU09_07750 [Acidimicrobiales bacterium]|nr:hypothetical protein [Acidimicrobiales bacterium]